jgi:hypothetical protein
MQGIKKGGTGRIPSVMRIGLLEITSTFLKASDVVAEDSLEKDGTLMVSSVRFGTSRKQSLIVIPTTVVDFWNPTSATIDGSGSLLVLPRSVMWWRNIGDPSEAIPMNNIDSSPLRLSSGIPSRLKRPPRSEMHLFVSSAPSCPQRKSAQDVNGMVWSGAGEFPGDVLWEVRDDVLVGVLGELLGDLGKY